jgi:hypothetical protein
MMPGGRSIFKEAFQKEGDPRMTRIRADKAGDTGHARFSSALIRVISGGTNLLAAAIDHSCHRRSLTRIFLSIILLSHFSSVRFRVFRGYSC